MSDHLESTIENLLLILEYAKHEPVSGISYHRLQARNFDGAELILDEGVGDEWFVFNPALDVCGPDILWPVDYAWIRPREIGEPKPDSFLYQFTRIRTISPKEARGRVRLVSPRMVEMTIAGVQDDLQSHISLRCYSSFIGRRWLTVTNTRGGSYHSAFDPNVGHSKGLESLAGSKDLSQMTNGLMHAAFAYRSWWHVRLQIGQGPSIRLAVTPQGAREIFKLRDLPEKSSRRAALRNWVCEHARRRGDSSIDVLKHLRGATGFVWNGLTCTVEPSADALEEAERLRIEKWGDRRRQGYAPAQPGLA